ncbi:TD and POZ domain-containing protein 3 [Argiope bruennichi]|uniref:TD and POZ domain-containing protein 3 n=1 Tax=Argiope bruennichi TaxID=94029 RepID=A0A8T0FAF8_ARGBR|nr:TD and POZ domain-containing protein 3 [Argiope bruennichi]
MASKMDGCTFVWEIENISHCWLSTGERIASPVFIADVLEDTKWSLWLYPMGYTDKNCVSFYLRREEDCTGPNVIKVNFQLSFLDKNGSFLTKETVFNWNFKKRNAFAHFIHASREKIFVSGKDEFLPNDTLMVQCTIWSKEGTPVKPKLISARTVYKINRRSFVWKIYEVNALKSGVRNKFKDDLIEFDLVLNAMSSFSRKLDIDIISFHNTIKYFSFKMAVINSKGEKEDSGAQEYFTDNLKKGGKQVLFFNKTLRGSKTLALQDHESDVLLLDCEFVSSNGTVVREHCGSGVILPKSTTLVAEREKSQNTSVLIDALKFMYKDGIRSDTELRTPTQIFPVHKNILSVRSPVFRRMFSNDMKEKNCGYVDITDLEDDTIHRMLLYIYTGTLEDMHFENACKLYAAADKYDIISLRSRCSAFLKESYAPPMRVKL